MENFAVSPFIASLFDHYKLKIALKFRLNFSRCQQLSVQLIITVEVKDPIKSAYLLLYLFFFGKVKYKM